MVGTLKSGKNRTVVLPAFVTDALAATCQGKGRDELIWPSAAGGYLAPPSSTESWLSGAVALPEDRPGVPAVTAHALRHTAASLAISAGANVKVVQRMLGHAKYVTRRCRCATPPSPRVWPYANICETCDNSSQHPNSATPSPTSSPTSRPSKPTHNLAAGPTKPPRHDRVAEALTDHLRQLDR